MVLFLFGYFILHLHSTDSLIHPGISSAAIQKL